MLINEMNIRKNSPDPLDKGMFVCYTVNTNNISQ